MVDTRPFCRGLDDLITLNPDTLQRGNAEWGNLGRKFAGRVAKSKTCSFVFSTPQKGVHVYTFSRKMRNRIRKDITNQT